MGKVCVRGMLTKKKKEREREKKANGHSQTIWLNAFIWLKKKKREKERATFVESSRLENCSQNDISYEQLKIGIRKEPSMKPQVQASASCPWVPIA